MNDGIPATREITGAFGAGICSTIVGGEVRVIKAEDELVLRARSGDRDAFTRLVLSYQRKMYSLALFYCKDPYDAEDLSQEVWLKAYSAMKDFRGESSFYTWVRKIMVNTFLKHKRSAKALQAEKEVVDIAELRDFGGALEGLQNVERSEEEKLHEKILLNKIVNVLAKLPSQQRMMFLLKYREGMTYGEIAAEMGCSVGTVKKSLFRAVVKMHQHFNTQDSSLGFTPITTDEKF